MTNEQINALRAIYQDAFNKRPILAGVKAYGATFIQDYLYYVEFLHTSNSCMRFKAVAVIFEALRKETAAIYIQDEHRLITISR